MMALIPKGRCEAARDGPHRCGETALRGPDDSWSFEQAKSKEETGSYVCTCMQPAAGQWIMYTRPGTQR